MARAQPRVQTRIDAVLIAVFAGFPLGVLGNVFVATTVFAGFALFESFGRAVEAFGWGLWGGAVTGLVTGGPVFALVAALRPLRHAWVRVFVPCLPASIVGACIEWLIPWTPIEWALWFYLPVVTLVVGSIVYLVRTRHLAPVWMWRGATPAHCDPNTCAHCSYDLRGIARRAPCPECGTARS